MGLLEAKYLRHSITRNHLLHLCETRFFSHHQLTSTLDIAGILPTMGDSVLDQNSYYQAKNFMDRRLCHDDILPRQMRACAYLLTALVLLALSLGSMPQEASAVTITSQSESQPFPGVQVIEGETSSPNTDFYAAFVSLCNDYVHVDASEAINSQSSGQWASSQGAQLAVNGDFYSWDDFGLHVYGDAVGGGQRWPSERTGRDSHYSDQWFYQRYGWIAFGDDFAEYSNTEWIKERWEDYGADQGWSPKSVTSSIPDGTQALISGFPQLVVEGNPIECSSPSDSSCFPDRGDMSDRHPRTAMGLSEDRNTFILVVVDGRGSSAGMYGMELADLMHQLGAHTAFNLDGGGSSQMWVEGQGTINDPSDGSPRSVPNSWGVFAGSSGSLPRVPGSCDRSFDELLFQSHLRDHLGHTDITGDEIADICARGPDGVECYRADGDGGFTESLGGPSLADDSGWSDPTNHSTLRMGDINGNGLADICVRANAGMRCYPSTGDGFGDHFEGPEWSNAQGFDDIRYFSTIRLADINGNGRADLCARTPDGFRCYPSTGDGFGEAIEGPSLTDDSGWGVPWHYGTIRMGDVTGDGRADVCARRNAGFACWPSTGDGFGSRIDGPEWSNAEGWDDVKYWSTIDLVDLDGNGRADVCARSPDGVVCHRSEGDGFGPEIEGPNLADDSGWDDYSNYSTMRFADVDGDGKMDLCARRNAGIRCWLWDGEKFDDTIDGGMANETGWYRERFFRTIRFADVTGDGRDDLCARASMGVVCWPSTGDGFAEDPVFGPEWSDDDGWDDPDYYTTLRLASPCRGDHCWEEPDPGGSPDAGLPDAGSPDPAEDAGDADIGSPGDPGQPAPLDSGTGGEHDAGSDDSGSTSTSSCACATSGTTPGELAGLIALLLLVWLTLKMMRRKKEGQYV